MGNKNPYYYLFLLFPYEHIFVIFRTKSNISFEGEAIINLSDLDRENKIILDQTDSAEGDETNPEITFENINSLDESYKIDGGPKEIFKKPHGVRGKEDKIIHEIKKGREERLAMMKQIKEAEYNYPIQIFFKSMASTVMTFPPELIVETRTRVNNIVSEMELRALTKKVNTPITTNNHAITTPSLSEVTDDFSNSEMSSTNVPDLSSSSSDPDNSSFAFLNYLNGI